MVGDCCLILILILLPPLGVFLMKGCDADFWINVYVLFFLFFILFVVGFIQLLRKKCSCRFSSCLTILGYIPGKAYFIACW